jgi:RNA-directed DNA polymerase
LKKRPGKSPRGLVVAPLRNRIVQRAILDVCQDDRPRIQRHLGELRDVLRTETSVGGLPGRGAQDALALIRRAIDGGATHFVRSDIKNFFVNVRRADVDAFLDENVDDPRFLALLKKGLRTDLDNANDAQIKAWWSIFPDDERGVPQGSSLSALCANVALRRLDRALNERGVTTIRYLDDFLILAPSGAKAGKAWQSAPRLLREVGLEAHEPEAGSAKAARGEVADGFDFLSFRVNSEGVSPSRSAKAELIGELTTFVTSV